MQYTEEARVHLECTPWAQLQIIDRIRHSLRLNDELLPDERCAASLSHSCKSWISSPKILTSGNLCMCHRPTVLAQSGDSSTSSATPITVQPYLATKSFACRTLTSTTRSPRQTLHGHFGVSLMVAFNECTPNRRQLRCLRPTRKLGHAAKSRSRKTGPDSTQGPPSIDPT
jgi:hypothetical protein